MKTPPIHSQRLARLSGVTLLEHIGHVGGCMWLRVGLEVSNAQPRLRVPLSSFSLLIQMSNSQLSLQYHVCMYATMSPVIIIMVVFHLWNTTQPQVSILHFKSCNGYGSSSQQSNTKMETGAMSCGVTKIGWTMLSSGRIQNTFRLWTKVQMDNSSRVYCVTVVGSWKTVMLGVI